LHSLADAYGIAIILVAFYEGLYELRTDQFDLMNQLGEFTPPMMSTGGQASNQIMQVVDNYTRESLAIKVGQNLKGEDVVNTLNRIASHRGLPVIIKVNNGSEFISKVMDKWAYEHRVELDFSRPGKPTDNARVESFNGRLRQECLNAHWFLYLEKD
jgi:IS30 family transposase